MEDAAMPLDLHRNPDQPAVSQAEAKPCGVTSSAHPPIAPPYDAQLVSVDRLFLFREIGS